MPRATWLPAALRAEGITVVETDGWVTRGIETFNPQGVVVHHDGLSSSVATSTALKLLTEGRRGTAPVPGPLCNIWLDDDNETSPVGGDPVAYLIASGRANHAGQGSWRGLTGNTSVLGIEARHTGAATEPWAPAAYDAYVRVVAAICRHGIPIANVAGHREWAPGRKIDPTFDMGQFRRDVAARVVAAPVDPSPPPPSQITQTQFTSLMYDDQAVNLAVLLGQSYDLQGGAATWPPLGLGSTGQWVRMLQGALRWVTGEPLVIDGQYGPITVNTVQRIQQICKIPVTGRTTAKTWACVRFLVGVQASKR